MAGNSEKIDEIIDPKALAQIDQLKAGLVELDRQFSDTLRGAIALNNATGNARNFSQYTQSATAAARETAKLQAEQVKLQQQILRLEAEQARLTTANNRAAQSTLSLTEAQRRAAEAAARVTANTQRQSGAYQQLQQVYNAVTLAARNAGVQFGTNSYQFRELSQQANGLRGRLDAIDQPLGNFQRNVGNYANAITGAFSKAFNGIRNLANILPGLGLSGAFLLIFDGLKLLVEQLGFFDSAVTSTELRINSFKEALKEGGAYNIAVKNVSELRENIKLAKEGFIDKDAVLKQYNETIGKTTGEVDNLNAAEAALNKNASAYIRVAFLKAVANSALEASAKKATEAQLASVQDAFEGAGFGDKAKAVLSGLTGSLTGSFDATAIAGKAIELKNKRVASAQDESNKLLKIFTDFQKQAAELAAKSGFNFFDTKVKDGTKNRIEEQLQAEKLAQDTVLNDEESFIQARLDAIIRYNNVSAMLIEQGVRLGVFTAQEGKNKILAIDNESFKNRQKIQKEGLKELADLEKEYNTQIKAARVAEAKNQDEIIKNSQSVFLQQQSQRLLALDKQRSEDIESASQLYLSGVRSKKQFEQDKADIESTYQQEALQVQLDNIQQLINLQKEFGLDTSNEEEKLARLKIKLSEEVTKKRLANNELEKESEKQKNALIKQLSEEAAQIVFTLIDAGFTNRKNAIEDEKTKLDDQTKSQIDAENRSLDSASQKADKIAVINAKAAAQKQVLDNQQKKIDQEKAKFDKAQAIARIIENTAIAVTSVLPNFILAALVGAIGAAQIANVLATPIPKYEKGTKSAKGGLSIWGEKGMELAIEPSGKMYTSPNSATLANIPAGTEIIPHMQLMGMLKAQNLRVKDAEQIGWKEVVQAIKGKKNEVNVSPRINGWVRENAKQQRWNEYRNNHFN